MFTLLYVANLFRTIHKKVYQNRTGFIEDLTNNILVFLFGSQCIFFNLHGLHPFFFQCSISRNTAYYE